MKVPNTLPAVCESPVSGRTRLAFGPLRLAILLLPTLVVSALAQSNVRLNVQIPSGYARLSITGAVGSVCSIQTRTNLAQTNWLTLTTFALTNTLQWWSDTNAPASGARWYRALVQPVTCLKYSYGSSFMGQDLAGYKIAPLTTNGRKALLNYEVHGFEDAWYRDGYGLTAIANRIKTYYLTNPAALNGWTVYLNPSANPDGEVYGVNNSRVGTAGAFGRCTKNGTDINRSFSANTNIEQLKLATLVTNVAPTIVLDFHGWCNTFYGTNTVGWYFADAFNASYTGKPSSYGYVNSAGTILWDTANGGIFHTNGLTRGCDYFTEFELNKRNIPSAIIEYPAPAFKASHVGTQVYDKTLDPGTGLYFMDADTLEIMIWRTEVALDNLFGNY